MTTASPQANGWSPLGHLGKPTGAHSAHSGQLHIEALPLQVSFDVFETMKANSLAAYPGEGCGFLIGTDGPDGRVIRQAIEVDNAAGEDQLRRFQMSPLDFLKAERAAAREGLEVLGIFHSHPDHRAIPSTHDLQGALPHLSYVILAVDGSGSVPEVVEVRSWQLDTQRIFSEETLLSQRNLSQSH